MVCGISDFQRKDYAENRLGATALDGVFFSDLVSILP